MFASKLVTTASKEIWTQQRPAVAVEVERVVL